MLTKNERNEKIWEVYKSLYLEQLRQLYTSGVNTATLSEETKSEIMESLFDSAKKMVGKFDELNK